jgi:Phosphate-induced protein 1 conserved region
VRLESRRSEEEKLMTTEEPPRVASDLEKAPEEHYPFDGLARGLASGELSRSRALKLMGAAVLGGALGFLSLPKHAEARRRRRFPIRYHNGALMTGGVNVYYIWYGTWNHELNTTSQILTNFITNLGGSPYYNINTTYYDSVGAFVSNSVIYGGSTDDEYSHGAALPEQDVAAVVKKAIDERRLPLDPNGVYFVLGAPDVTTVEGTDSLFCTRYCGFHDFIEVDFIPVKYAFIGNPERCPDPCAPAKFGATPNGNLAADAMVNQIANQLSSAATNPLGTGWFDRRGRENADKCAGRFGTTYAVANGAKANMRLGQRDYLIQKNWVNKGRGYCALSYP